MPDVAPTFIGLDLSLASTGIARIQAGVPAVARIKSKPTGPTSGEQVIRLHRIVSDITAQLPTVGETFVAVEGPAFGANDKGAHIRGGLWWAVRHELHLAGFHTLVIPPSNVKKYATGKGNAQKDAVLAAVIRRYPTVDVTGNDEADALVLAAMAARFHGHAIDDLPAAHLAAMKGIGR